MNQSRYWRWHSFGGGRVGLSNNSPEAEAYQQAGYVEIPATETIPAHHYSIGGPDTRVRPDVWDSIANTGIPATRRGEFCDTCGTWKGQPGGCMCKRHKPTRTSVITTRPSRVRQRTSMDIVCHPRCKRYFQCGQKAGIADTVDAYLVYHKAGFTRIPQHRARLMSDKSPNGAFQYTVNGPARCCTRSDFGNVLWGRKRIADVPTFPPIPSIDGLDNTPTD